MQVANSSMCQPIRSLTEARGHHTADHHLASFGGAGGQHACAIAQALGIRRVKIHKYSSILSAYGIGLADVVHEAERPCAKIFESENISRINDGLDTLSQEVRDHSSLARFRSVDTHRFLNMRYDGSDTAMMILQEGTKDPKKAFIDAHHQQFGFTPTGRSIFVDTVRVRGVGRQGDQHAESSTASKKVTTAQRSSSEPATIKPVFFGGLGWTDTSVYLFEHLGSGDAIDGPAIVVDKTQTLLVGPECRAHIEQNGLSIEVNATKTTSVTTTELDPVALSVFRHRFMGVAEQMGRVLQNVSVSANIKERLDFSCAIFTPEGNLVANAPHVPAMIGSMAFAVKGQIEHWKGKLQDGDVLLSNSPGTLFQT